jgi:hypothetical protein
VSNRLTTDFADALWTAQVNWPTLSLRVLLVDVDYVMDPEAPEDVASPIATSNVLTGLAVAAGWAKADAALFPVVADAREIVGAVLVEDGSTTPIMLLDTIVGLPAHAPDQPFWLAWQETGICRL